MTTNNKISNLVNSQVPFFVRNDHRTFVTFLEKYYEYLEQNEPALSDGKVIERIKNITQYFDVDKTLPDLSEKIYSTYLNLIPNSIATDKALVLKHVKDLYRAKGTEKALLFFVNILTGQSAEVYYPKKDVLRASDGKWYVQKVLRVDDPFVNGVANTDGLGLYNFVNKYITGNNSNSSAIVEKVETYYDNGTKVNEITISSSKGYFEGGEQIFTLFEENGVTKSLYANVFNDIFNTITITVPGSGYSVGDPIIINHPYGTGANATVDTITLGYISGVAVVSSGAGFKANSPVTITSNTGSGGSITFNVDTSGNTHPNSYNIIWTTVGSIASANINNVNYGTYFVGFQPNSNANTTLANSLSTFVYANVGPITSAFVNTFGSLYATAPTLDVQANTIVRSMGILGKMQINDGGTSYVVGDTITFVNPLGGFGSGALANVTAVNATGSITKVSFQQMSGHIIGGEGYNPQKLPYGVVTSSNLQASGANIAAVAILGDNENLVVSTAPLGAILTIKVNNRGTGYNTVPTLNLTVGNTHFGANLAQAVATIIPGHYTYPGRYINDDSHLSEYNYLQDRDYYQNFSYVVRVSKSYDDYVNSVKQLLHPSGMKIFNQYMSLDQNTVIYNQATVDRSNVSVQKLATYKANLGNVVITLSSHGYSQNDNVYVEFITGDTANVNSGIFMINSVYNGSTFNIAHANTSNTNGSAYVGPYI
jgi:hypothetical protein